MKLTKRERTLYNKNMRSNLFPGLLMLILVIGMLFTACDAPAGSEGPQGPEGPEGPIGPAGEDGSMIYSGEGAPGNEVGTNGDYYLDQNTGELYGPKDSGGWDDPIIVLMGEDGQDGEDGSQIYSGSGAPDALLGAKGDYYLDEDSYELYGPKSSEGWGSPLNLKGADGNANVTRYLFPGHDFSSDADFYFFLNDLETEEEFRESAWLGYLFSDPFYYPVPGPGSAGGSEYRFTYQLITSSNEIKFLIDLNDGIGEAYDRVEVVRIEASETVDNRKQKGDTIIPDHLDLSDYEEVARYYGFWHWAD